jgi:hypothetical protein
LIAGAIQEEELVQQPDNAFSYAKLDRAIIWDGRGQVIKPIFHLLASPICAELI